VGCDGAVVLATESAQQQTRMLVEDIRRCHCCKTQQDGQERWGGRSHRWLL
jgi:hypothetical protein